MSRFPIIDSGTADLVLRGYGVGGQQMLGAMRHSLGMRAQDERERHNAFLRDRTHRQDMLALADQENARLGALATQALNEQRLTELGASPEMIGLTRGADPRAVSSLVGDLNSARQAEEKDRLERDRFEYRLSRNREERQKEIEKNVGLVRELHETGVAPYVDQGALPPEQAQLMGMVAEMEARGLSGARIYSAITDRLEDEADVDVDRARREREYDRDMAPLMADADPLAAAIARQQYVENGTLTSPVLNSLLRDPDQEAKERGKAQLQAIGIQIKSVEREMKETADIVKSIRMPSDQEPHLQRIEELRRELKSLEQQQIDLLTGDSAGGDGGDAGNLPQSAKPQDLDEVVAGILAQHPDATDEEIEAKVRAALGAGGT